MADAFERRLERLFSDAPHASDAEAFAARVERRLDRGWAVRRLLIGSAGLAGGMIGVSQLIMSDFLHRVGVASEDGAQIVGAGWKQVAPGANLLASLPFSAEGVWVAVALAVVAMGFAVSRMIEEF
jgi:hypothetical protein